MDIECNAAAIAVAIASQEDIVREVSKVGDFRGEPSFSDAYYMIRGHGGEEETERLNVAC